MAMKNYMQETVRLSGGTDIPQFGLGTWRAEPGPAKAACLAALRMGYRLIDTAQYYKNEEDVGAAVAEFVASGGPRPYIVTKLAFDQMGAAAARAALQESLRKLRVECVDLFLLHSPKEGSVVETWAEVCKLRTEGLVTAAGVSNFGVAQLEGLAAACGGALPAPELNQIELHPWLHQAATVAYCAAHNIAVMGYCPLARCQRFGAAFRGSPVGAVAAATEGANEAQVAIRWSLQKGFITIPKSTSELHLRQNANAAGPLWPGGKISDADMAAIDGGTAAGVPGGDGEFKASGSVGWMDIPWDEVK